MSADDQMPDRLGPYRLLDRIGEGGMGVVYLARDRQHRTVAVKVLRAGVAGEPNALRRLAREVETMRMVRSPFVAEVISADVTGDLPYIVTQYVPGRTLDQAVAAQGPLRGAALAGLARGLADALAAVHAAGVVHRDLKPGNVMMLDGSPVVIDFGIAQGADATRLTMTGMFMGTPGYLAPEVIEGHPSSEASDVHAWGATVAFAATGRPPYGTGSYETIFYKIVNGQPDLDGAPPTLLPLLAAAMAREPAHRPPAIQLSALAGVLDPGRLVPGPAAGAGQRAGPAPAATRAEPGQPGLADGFPGAAGAVGMAAGGIPLPGAALSGPPDPGLMAGVQPTAVPGGVLAGDGAAAGPARNAAGPAADSLASRGAGDGVAGNGVAGGAAAARLAAGALAADPAGAAGASGQPGTRPNAAGQRGSGRAGVRPADYADVLPPVVYQAPAGRGPDAAAGPAAGPRVTAGDQPAPTASPRGHSLLAAATMVVLVCVSVLLPVAGTAAALVLIALLRAGDAARRGAAIRRSARGARPTDLLVATIRFPWYLTRAVTGLLLQAPFAAATGALVAGITMIVMSADRLPHAIAYGAGTLVAYYGLGPRSASPRQQLRHLYARVARNRVAQAAALIAVIALAAGAVTAAASWPPLYSPVHPPASFSHPGAAPAGPSLLPARGQLPFHQLRR